MGPVMVTGFGQFLSNLVETWPARSGRCGGRRSVVGNLRRSLWAEHCPEMVFLVQENAFLVPYGLRTGVLHRVLRFVVQRWLTACQDGLVDVNRIWPILVQFGRNLAGP